MPGDAGLVVAFTHEQVVVRVGLVPVDGFVDDAGEVVVCFVFGSDAALAAAPVVAALHEVERVANLDDERAPLDSFVKVLALQVPVGVDAVEVAVCEEQDPLLPGGGDACEVHHQNVVATDSGCERPRFCRGCRVQLIGPIIARRNQMRPPAPTKPRSQFRRRSWARRPVRVLSSSAARATRPGSPVFGLWNMWLSARLIRCFNPIWPLPLRSCSTVSSLRLMSVRSALSVLVVLFGMRGASKGMLGRANKLSWENKCGPAIACGANSGGMPDLRRPGGRRH